MILLIALVVSCYSMFLWTSIMITDKLVGTDKWYWQMLLFLGAHMLVFAELGFFLVGISLFFHYKHHWYERNNNKRAPRRYRVVQILNIGLHIAFFIYTLT
jgi:hypothetical protein